MQRKKGKTAKIHNLNNADLKDMKFGAYNIWKDGK